jgi:hypothetical protein
MTTAVGDGQAADVTVVDICKQKIQTALDAEFVKVTGMGEDCFGLLSL